MCLQCENSLGMLWGLRLTGSHLVLRDTFVERSKEKELRRECAFGVEGSGPDVSFSPASHFHSTRPGTLSVSWQNVLFLNNMILK